MRFLLHMRGIPHSSGCEVLFSAGCGTKEAENVFHTLLGGVSTGGPGGVSCLFCLLA